MAGVAPMAGGQDVIAPLAKPLAAPGNHVIVLHGSLAPGGCVIKMSGKHMDTFRSAKR